MTRRCTPTIAVLLLLLCPLLVLTGCDSIRGVKSYKAQYKFPEHQRIAVVVDAAPSSGAEVSLPDTLGQSLTDYLFQHKAGDNFVRQDSITYLQRTGELKNLTLEEVAKKVNADLILYVHVTIFHLHSYGDPNIAAGEALASIRVTDRNGHRLMPAAGADPDTAVAIAPDKNYDFNTARDYLVDRLTVHIGRTFHDYTSDDPYVSRDP